MLGRRHPLAVAGALALGVALLAAGCGGDDGDGATTTATAEVEPVGDLCALLEGSGALERSGLDLGPGEPTSAEGRSVCAYSGAGPGTAAVTVGVTDGRRFTEQASRSEQALGDPGEEVDGLGDEALFFFDDTEVPDGLGGVLVATGERTVDVTVQGVGAEDGARRAATTLAEAVVDGLP